MTNACRLAEKPVWSFDQTGAVHDLADPDINRVCFVDLGEALAKIARFNGRNPGAPYSVAQHCAMGAEAIINEGGSRRDAALFLLHDAHEAYLGDLPSPAGSLYAAVAEDLYGEERFADAIAAAKGAWDEVIYAAAGLPGPEAWTKRERQLVKSMDARMVRAEAIALFGPRASRQFPLAPPPKTRGAIRPKGWAAAAEDFQRLARTLIGEDRVLEQRAALAAITAREE